MSLSLSRQPGDEIYLDIPGCQRVTIRVVEVRPGRVKLRIEAPPEIRIARDDAKRGAAEKSVDRGWKDGTMMA